MTLGSFRSRIAHVSLVVVLCATAGLAGAQTASIPIALEHCPSELGAAVESALDVELSEASPDARRALAEGQLRCALVCDDAGITASVTRGDERIEQRIAREVAGAPRRLAIALAELVEASRLPVTTTEDAVVVAPPPPPAPAPVAPPDRFRARARLSGGVWLGGEPFLALGAAQLGAELSPTRNVAIVLDASGAFGALGVASARLDVRLLSASLSLRIGGEWGPFWLGGGPLASGGAVLWTGTPTDPAQGIGRDVVGGWLGLGAIAVALGQLPDLPLRIGLEVEGGGIAIYSGALVLDALAQRIGGGWLELRAVLDLTIE